MYLFPVTVARVKEMVRCKDMCNQKWERMYVLSISGTIFPAMFTAAKWLAGKLCGTVIANICKHKDSTVKGETGKHGLFGSA